MRMMLASLGLLAGAATAQPAPPPLFEKPLADLPGREIALVEVVLPPGGSSPPHRHNAHVLVYVLEGSLVMQVAGKPAQTIAAGQTFSEDPGDIHSVGRNASATAPARFLAFYVKQRGAPRTVPLP